MDEIFAIGNEDDRTYESKAQGSQQMGSVSWLVQFLLVRISVFEKQITHKTDKSNHNKEEERCSFFVLKIICVLLMKISDQRSGYCFKYSEIEENGEVDYICNTQSTKVRG